MRRPSEALQGEGLLPLASTSGGASSSGESGKNSSAGSGLSSGSLPTISDVTQTDTSSPPVSSLDSPTPGEADGGAGGIESENRAHLRSKRPADNLSSLSGESAYKTDLALRSSSLQPYSGHSDEPDSGFERRDSASIAARTHAMASGSSSHPQSDASRLTPSSTPSSPRFHVASALASSRGSEKGDNPAGLATAARRTAGALRGARMGKVTPQQLESGSNSPRRDSQPMSHSDDDEREVWEPSIVASNVVTPPGAVTELPSMTALSPTGQMQQSGAPWLAPHAQQAPAEYDWASFVYAYSRGKWDPARLPQPPSQSNLYPGAESRIGSRPNDGAERTAATEKERGAGRRPSVDYVTGPGTIHRLFSEPDRRSLVKGSRTPPPIASPPLTDMHERAKSALVSESRGLEDGNGADLGQATSEDSSSPKFIDPFTLLHLATSSSAPQVRQASALGDFAQRIIERRNPPQRSGVQHGSKTDSELMTRASMPRLPSDPLHSRLEGPQQPSPKSDSQHTTAFSPTFLTTPTSAIAATRPALAAQVSELTLNATHTSRGNEVRRDGSGTSSAGGVNMAQRPHPKPVQSDVHDSEVSDGKDMSQASTKKGNLVAISSTDKEDLADIIGARASSAFDTFGDAKNKATQADSSAPPHEVDEGHKSFTAPPYVSDRAYSGGAEGIHGTVRKDIQGDEPRLRRTSEVALPKMPVDLAHIGPSNSSPSLSTYLGIGRRVEAFYRDFGYLPAILPPDEAERRQALRRYGPPRVRGNANFERIAHLVKLVFNTKIVLISLVGESTQFFQTEVGAQSIGYTSEALQQMAASRDCSMCAHAILQQTDEPLVVLDTQRDWRFAGNPLVSGAPGIRFYAGSPLRTSDGFNLGSLCIIDDRPWPEFSPRHRHTLREFARVVMREMELIRDTIHIRTQDRMQHSIELFTRKCIEMESDDSEDDGKGHTHGLHQVYALAAKSMCDALQATGAIVFDLSQFELVPSHSATELSDGESRIFMPSPFEYPETITFVARSHGDATNATSSPSVQGHKSERNLVPPMAVLGACETQAPPSTRDESVPASHYVKIAEFLRKHRTGFFYPFTPAPFRHLLPPGMSNLLLVPIFGLNRQPFALLCAYSRHTEDGPTLDDIQESGLQYLRAMGTIILSAILKKDIMLADQAKSHFISNISHELRTPLHGILAAAELLAETKLNTTQGSYLETVEACGKSLLELVNHVLDFTKLSGNLHATQSSIKPSQRCDLVKLVQEVCESSWIGQMAKNLESQQHSGIGSAYAKGSEASSTRSGSDQEEKKSVKGLRSMVETVIDVSMRPTGWLVKCDAGGIRRVLMNLIGNSLKFTSKGFVHVSLREVQTTDTHVLVELGVTDTGKGISRTFLEEQLFHPFTQENHLGPGTGLGLSIVNSIVQSPAINGKIDVWSTVGQGTEIRVTCELELSDPSEAEGPIYRPTLNVEHQRSICFVGFDESLRGHSDLKDVLRSYFEDWWRFKFLEGGDEGDIILVNDDFSLVREVIRTRSKPLPPIILLTSARGSADVSAVCDEYQNMGGVVRLLFKPAGPAKLEAVTDFCLQCYERGRAGIPMLDPSSAHDTPLPSPAAVEQEEKRTGYFTEAEPDDDAVTPKGPPHPKTSDSHSQSGLCLPERPRLNSNLRQKSHHISPGPPSASDTALLRRHSSEDRGIKQSRPSVISEEGGAVHASSGSTNSTSGSGSSNSTRPVMPTRSITYHEPRLQRHVLMSPLRSPHYRRADGEAMDYFGPAASLTSGGGDKTSFGSSMESASPSSPGSVISLEGGEGAMLRSSIHTAGLVRGHPGSPAPTKKRLQILSVEDNSINRRVLAAFFSKMDVDLVEATNGEEGVKAFESYPPFHFDVIFMDLSMPVLDGIGATMQIRKIEADRFRAEQSSTSAWLKVVRNSSNPVTTPGGSNLASSASSSPLFAAASSAAKILGTPGGSRPSAQARAKIFALTGRSSEEDKRRAFATGADGFIVKPLGFKVLSTLINTISAYR